MINKKNMNGTSTGIYSFDVEQLKIRKAKKIEIRKLLKVIEETFKPYKTQYTHDAYRTAILLSRDDFESRLSNKNKDVLVAIYNHSIVGTVSIEYCNKEYVHVKNMVVLPPFQRQGIGQSLLSEIERLAKEKKRHAILLECFDPLIQAQKFYKKTGFKKTGRKIPFHGVTFFEMKKDI